MSAIEEVILDEFFKALGTIEEVPSSMVDALKAYLVPDRKLKPDELLSIFSPPPESDLP